MPKLKDKSKQYLFKNKLRVRRKSKKDLLKESLFMMLSASFLLLINYLIPQKELLFSSFNNNILNIFNSLLEIFLYSFKILIVLLVCFSLLFSIFLILGSINRIFKVIYYKSKKIRLR